MYLICIKNTNKKMSEEQTLPNESSKKIEKFLTVEQLAEDTNKQYPTFFPGEDPENLTEEYKKEYIKVQLERINGGNNN